MITELERGPLLPESLFSPRPAPTGKSRITGATQRIAPWLVVLAAAGVYLNSLHNGFALDDRAIIESNARVHDLAAWRDIWLQPYWPSSLGTQAGLYRPFAIFLYAVEWLIGGGAPWVFHAGSVLLHGLATLLVFLLLDRLTARLPALVGAVVFAVHPVHVEAVANVVGQAELVAAIALFGGCLVHMTRPAGAAVSWPRRVALVGLFALGLLTKESAAVLPALLVVFDVTQHRVQLSRRALTEYARAMLMPLFLLAATFAFYLTLRSEALGGVLLGLEASPSMPHLGEAHRVLNALRAFPEFMRLLFFPQDLSADYSPGILLPVESITALTAFGACLLLSLTALSFTTPWLPAAGLPAAWFLLTILPVSNLFFPIGVLVAERTLYTPSFAVCLAIAFVWLKAAPQASRSAQRLAPVLVAGILVLLAARTWTRTPVWQSTGHVFTSLVREHPESYRAQTFLGTYFWERGDYAGAEERYSYAYRLFPRDPQVLLFYGGLLHARGKTAEAIGLMERSYDMAPFYRRTAVTLADAYLTLGQWARALEFARRAERMGADRTQAMAMHAMAYHGLRRHDQAVGAWRVAAANPTVAQWVIQAHLARALVIAGYDREAHAALELARQLVPDTAGQRTIQQLDTAIRARCYDHLRPDRNGTPAFVLPPCDPLRGFQWSEFKPGA